MLYGTVFRHNFILLLYNYKTYLSFHEPILNCAVLITWTCHAATSSTSKVSSAKINIRSRTDKISCLQVTSVHMSLWENPVQFQTSLVKSSGLTHPGLAERIWAQVNWDEKVWDIRHQHCYLYRSQVAP